MADQRAPGGGQSPKPADRRGPDQPAAGPDDTQILDRGAPVQVADLDETAILAMVEPASPNRPELAVEPEVTAPRPQVGAPAKAQPAPSMGPKPGVWPPPPAAKPQSTPARPQQAQSAPASARPQQPPTGAATTRPQQPPTGAAPARPQQAAAAPDETAVLQKPPAKASASVKPATASSAASAPMTGRPATGTARPATGSAAPPKPATGTATPASGSAKPVPPATGTARPAVPASGSAKPAPAKPAAASAEQTAVMRVPVISGAAAPAKPAPPARKDPSPDDTAVLRTPAPPAPDQTAVIRTPDEPWKSPEPAGDRTAVLRTGTVAPPPADDTAVLRLPDKDAAGKPTTEAQPERRRTPRPSGLGQAPWVLVVSSIGVLMVALAYMGGRDQAATWPNVLYWAAQVVVFAPVVLRLLSQRLAGGTEAFVLVIGLAIAQYLQKWMYSPDQFRFPDELQHWAATTIINESGELFQPNLALPPAVHFPGLAEMGASVSQLTGLSVTASGLLVAGILRLVFVGAFFAVVLRSSRSPAIAGVACVIYATALHYLFFNAMYLYGAAALPFLMLSVWAARRWWSGGDWQFALITVIGVAMTTVSHHVTAFVLVMTLFLLAATEFFTRRPRHWRSLVLPFVALIMVVSWIAFVARDVVAYLEAPFEQVVTTIETVLSGQSESSTPVSTSVPIWQLALQGIGLLCLFALYLAVGRDMLAKRDRDAWRWSLLIGGAVFFGGNAVRFLGSNGPEIAGRLNTFTYVPMSVIGAIALVNAVRLLPQRGPEGIRWLAPSPPRPPARRAFTPRLLIGAGVIIVLMLGARAGGWPPAASLLPGQYVAAGFERSVDAYGTAAADWEFYTLGPRKRIGGDITAVSLGSTYGRQDPVREAAPIFYDNRWDAADDELVDRVGLEYIVVDRRITDTLPVNGAYFDNDPQAGQITEPMSIHQISKFDTVPRISRLYDNGNVRIYRMGHL